ncbi:MAG: DsbA family oxidoreductase [Moritella sp.]|uniref:DsbA family oxidoreductase n=1 Tax=Moritella sp. TaxID=78556 RepID=UPI0029AED4A6|nr:DsbA family oxidoreductase [Moritella sp.]MDX2321212.1 DsbA family oxidoreductase [Moritella sp.]
MNAIDVYLDFTCPYSYIGHHRIAEAIRLNASAPNNVQYRAFQLNPNLPEAGIPRATYRERKFGSMEESRRRDNIVVNIANNEGLKINFDNISLTPNTRRAHRAIKIAEAQSKDSSALYDQIFSAYFTKGQDIGDTQVLIELAAKLDVTLTEEQLNSNATNIDKTIDKDIADAHSVGLTAVPFVVDSKNATHISVTNAVYALTKNN